MSKYNSWLGLNGLEVLKKVLGNTKQREIRMSVYLAADVDEIAFESEIESVCVADKWYYLNECGNIVVRRMYQIHFLRWKGSCFFGCDLRLKKMRAEFNEKIGKGTTDPSHWVLKLYGRLKSDRVTDTSGKSTPPPEAAWSSPARSPGSHQSSLNKSRNSPTQGQGKAMIGLGYDKKSANDSLCITL